MGLDFFTKIELGKRPVFLKFVMFSILYIGGMTTLAILPAGVEEWMKPWEDGIGDRGLWCW